MKKILIVEDDTDLQEGLSFSLQQEGCAVIAADTLKRAWELLESEGCDLILLDCNLPDGSGFDFCIRVKKKYRIPILMLTARDTEMDEVKALELGMDDFMSKPFSLAVLKARIKKLIADEGTGMKLVSNGITVDKNTCKIYKNGEELECSKIEYQMLLYFMENAGIVLSKEQILSHVWDCNGKYVGENAVPVNIRRLRARIEDDPQNPGRIQTVYGIGYIWKREGNTG